MKYFEKAFYILIFLIPFSFALNLFKDTDMASMRVFVSLFFVSFIFFLFYKNKNIFLYKFKNWHTYFFVSFFAFTMLSSIWSLNPVWSIRKFIFFATLIPLYFLIIYFVDSKERIEKVSKIFILGGFTASFVAILQFISQFFFSLDKIYDFWAYKISFFVYGQNFGEVVINNQSWFVNIGGRDYLRAISLFPDPHTFSLYLGILIPFSIGFFVYNNKKHKKYYLPAIATMLLALLFTFSRGAYVGLIVSFLFAGIFYLRSKKLHIEKRYVLGILSSFFVFVFIFLNTVFGSRLLSSFSLDDISNIGRLSIWKTSMGVFLDNPILGVGLGSLPVIMDPMVSVKSPINAHNTYLDVSSELGFFGLFLFLALFAISFKFLSFKKDKFNLLRLGIVWSIAWFMVHSFFETSIFSVQVLSSLIFVFAFAVILNREIKGISIKF